MAISKNWTDDSKGLVVNDAYHKFEQVETDGDGALITMSVYATRDARMMRANPLYIERISIPYVVIESSDGESIVEKSYNAIKQLPEFSGSADV